MDLSVYSTNDLKLFENRKRNTVSGYLNLDKEEIFLEKKLTPTMTSVVLMHEILHAILYRGGVVDQDEKIETMIEILSYGIIEVLKKNPKFVSYILKEKKE
jgi:Zn-dependent peptidase ImmA (M78 family)